MADSELFIITKSTATVLSYRSITIQMQTLHSTG